MIREPRGVLFDLGQTIFTHPIEDETGRWKRVLEHAVNPRGVKLDDVLRVSDEILCDIYPRCRKVLLEFPVQSFHRMVFDRLGLTFSISASEIESIYFDAGHTTEIEEGVIDALDTLQKHGIPLGVVSNTVFSGDMIRQELQRQGILDRFEFVISSTDYGIRKPHPLMFTTAAAKMALPHSDIWFVGDHAEADCAGAAAVGMTSVWYNPNKIDINGFNPDVTVDSWAQFIEVLNTTMKYRPSNAPIV